MVPRESSPLPVAPEAPPEERERTVFVRAPSMPPPFVPGQTGTRMIEPVRSRLRAELARGNYEEARVAALELLARDPTDTEAFELCESCHDYLFREYVDRLGSLTSVPMVRLAADEMVKGVDVDHRAGFILHLIDGTSNVETVLDACGMDRLDALRILHELVERGIIEMWNG
jgi:hypothetical protein